MAFKLPPFLAKKVGPLPLGVWLVAGAAGVGIGLYIKKHSSLAGGGLTDTGAALEDDMAGYPYAADSTGLGGGLGGGGGYAPETDGGYLPAAADESQLPGWAGNLAPVATQFPTERVPRPGTPGNCPPGYYWNGVLCMPKVVAGSARVQPGATPPAAPGQTRLCPKGWHWNGFDCVPDAAAPKYVGPIRTPEEFRAYIARQG